MTNPADVDAQTIAIYDTQAMQYRDSVAENTDVNLQPFIDSFDKGSRILDFGCGVGNAAGLMHEAGLVVDAADASEGMLALAAEYQGLNLIQMRFSELNAVAYYDGIWANFSLLHALKSEMSEILGSVHTALKPDGIFFMALKKGHGESRDELGRRYAYYTQDECEQALLDAGLKTYHITSGSGIGLAGTRSEWIGFFTRKPGSDTD